jgi:VWFA-related protein
MRHTAKLLLTGLVVLAGAASLSLPAALLRAQAPAPQTPPPAPGEPTFTVSADLISTDVIVRDARGQFVPDLKEGDFEVYEDGVKQSIVSFLLSHGGRTLNTVTAPAVVQRREGVFLPPSRPTTDSSGRVFILFIDDNHLDFRVTPRTRDLLKRMLTDLIHEGDMFGIVTTGTSSLEQQLTYDRKVLEDAIERITGGALRPSEILSQTWSSQGPMEVRHRAHVTFETLNDLLKNLEKIQNRRKAIIYLSSGYDFNPFEKTRFDQTVERMRTTAEQLTYDPFFMNDQSQLALSEADLWGELTYLTRMANRVNATIYTIDPRGLIAGQDVDEHLDQADFLEYVRETQTTLRVLAEETGGLAIVNQNDFTRGLKRIDAETSDYYLLGYYSNNPDPLRRTRRLEIRVVGRDDLEVSHRQDYILRPVQRPQ